MADLVEMILRDKALASFLVEAPSTETYEGSVGTGLHSTNMLCHAEHMRPRHTL